MWDVTTRMLFPVLCSIMLGMTFFLRCTIVQCKVVGWFVLSEIFHGNLKRMETPEMLHKCWPSIYCK